ncbi:MAG: hypothetical protein H6766_02410 [Candidatus Peribacteria bacterium]|nr:MAG: hypothetical protein H6766_02410 [Candidatus Peribacteria bacterium]
MLIASMAAMIGRSYAASTDVCIDDYDDGSELCLTLDSTSYGYKMEVDDMDSDLNILSCVVDVPGENFVTMGDCEGAFNADEDDDFTIYVRVNQDGEEYNSTLEFDCNNGSCDVDDYSSSSS